MRLRYKAENKTVKGLGGWLVWFVFCLTVVVAAFRFSPYSFPFPLYERTKAGKWK